MSIFADSIVNVSDPAQFVTEMMALDFDLVQLAQWQAEQGIADSTTTNIATDIRTTLDSYTNGRTPLEVFRARVAKIIEAHRRVIAQARTLNHAGWRRFAQHPLDGILLPHVDQSKNPPHVTIAPSGGHSGDARNRVRHAPILFSGAESAVTNGAVTVSAGEYSLADVAARSHGEVVLTDSPDLTDEMLAETAETYRRMAENYIAHYERTPGAADAIQPHTLFPFLDIYERFNLHKPVLFVGSGSGRDLQTAEARGINAVGIDTSPTMLNFARQLGVRSPLHQVSLLDMDFPSASFSGLFCDTALNHTKKVDLPKTLRKFREVLEPGGIAFLGFRRGEGQVYFTNDVVGGRRYNISLTLAEVQHLLESAGFEIIRITTNNVPNRPQIINCFVRAK